MSIESLTTFLGWCTVMNLTVLILFFGVLVAANEGVGQTTAKWFGVTPEDTRVTLFRMFMQYRLMFAFANLVPYIALKIMT